MKKSIFSKILILLFIVFFFSTFFIFFFQDHYQFVFSFEWFFKNAVSGKTKDFYSGLYTDFLLAYMGIYFTVLGIAFSLKQFSIKTFFEFTIDIWCVICFTFQIINSIIVYCFIPNLRFTNAVVCFLLLNLVYETFLFCFLSSKILYTDNIDWANKLFERIVKQGNRKRTSDFINHFLIKCFKDDSGLIINKACENIVFTKGVFDSIIVTDIQDIKTLESLIKSSVKMLSINLLLLDKADEDKNDSEICERSYKLIEFYSIASRHLYFGLGKDECNFLDVRDCFLYANKVKSSKYYDFYSYICYQLRNLIITCIFCKSNETIYHFINQYRYLNQFLYSKENDSFNSKFNQNLFDIVCYIYNQIVVGKRKSDLIDYAEKLFLSLDSIEISCVDYNLFDEGFYVETDFHEVKYTQEFLAALILFITSCRKKDFDVERYITDKIRFVGYGNVKISYTYLNIAISSLKRNFEKLTEDEFQLFFRDGKDFNQLKSNFISILQDMIDRTQKQEINELEKQLERKINYEIEIKKDELKNEIMKHIEKYDKDKEVKRFNIDSEILISGKCLCGNGIEMGYDFFSCIQDVFIQIYIRNSECIQLNSFSELASIPNKSSSLIINTDLLEKLFDDKSIDTGYMTFSVGEKVFNYSFYRGNSNGIIFQDDFKNHFSLVEIKVIGKPSKEKLETDIIYKVPIKLIFCENSDNSQWFKIN